MTDGVVEIDSIFNHHITSMFTHSTKTDLPLSLCMCGRREAKAIYCRTHNKCYGLLKCFKNNYKWDSLSILKHFIYGNVLVKCRCLPQKLLWPQLSEDIYLLYIKYLLHIYFETSGLVVDVYHSLCTVALHLVAVVFHAVPNLPIHLFDWRPPGLFQPVIGCSVLSSNIRLANLKFQKDLFSRFFL